MSEVLGEQGSGFLRGINKSWPRVRYNRPYSADKTLQLYFLAAPRCLPGLLVLPVGSGIMQHCRLPHRRRHLPLPCSPQHLAGTVLDCRCRCRVAAFTAVLRVLLFFFLKAMSSDLRDRQEQGNNPRQLHPVRGAHILP